MDTKIEHADAGVSVKAEVDVQQELARALELTGDQHVASYEARNRIDYDRRGRRMGGALVIDCMVDDGEAVQWERRVEIDDQRRPMSEEAIAHLGLEAISWQNRGYVIRRDYSA